eukprot:SAG11_NODE_4634_length_1826_cov_1.086277_2_plen_296_part_00
MNWTNAQLATAISTRNYQLTIESWKEQRSYIENAILNLEANGHHGTFKAEILAALRALAPPKLSAARAVQLRPGGDFTLVDISPQQRSSGNNSPTVFHCAQHGGATISFGSDGSIASLRFSNSSHAVGEKLGQVRYQTFSAENFTTFDSLYTNNCLSHNSTAIETVGCHNFLKPNMSSAYGGDPTAGYGVFSPKLTRLWRRSDSCAFVSEATFAPELYIDNGAPRQVLMSVAIMASGELALNVSLLNKTASRRESVCALLFVSSEARCCSSESTVDCSARSIVGFLQASRCIRRE